MEAQLGIAQLNLQNGILTGLYLDGDKASSGLVNGQLGLHIFFPPIGEKTDIQPMKLAELLLGQVAFLPGFDQGEHLT